MKFTIKKDDNFLCIKDYFMDDDMIGYRKDNVYISDNDHNLPSDAHKIHEMEDEEDFFDYFVKLNNKVETVSVSDKALRFNTGKPRWSLVHFKSLEPFVRVLEFGATKYAPFNWQKTMDLGEILDSTQRHLAAMIDGEENDPESKLQHAGHVICNMMFYIYHKDKMKCCGNWDDKGKCKCKQ